MSLHGELHIRTIFQEIFVSLHGNYIYVSLKADVCVCVCESQDSCDVRRCITTFRLKLQHV